MKKISVKVNKLSYRQEAAVLFFIGLIGVIIHTFAFLNLKQLYVVPDEAIYINAAKSYFYSHKFEVHGSDIPINAILYPFLLSFFMFIKNTIIRYYMIGIFNTILLVSSIIPTYLLSKKIIKRKDISFMITVAVLLLPDMNINITYMAENLFFPLSIWLFYLVYLFIKEEKIKTSYVYLVLISMTIILLYATKNVALYFVLAFVSFILYDMFFEKMYSIKRNIKTLCIFLTSFIFFYFIYNNLICVQLLGIDKGKGYQIITNIGNSQQVVFLVKVLIFNSVCATLAFMFFPLILTLFEIKNERKENRLLFVFILSSFIFAIGVISYMTNLREDMNSALGIRQHLRYYSAIFIPLLILFANILMIKGKNEKAKSFKLLFIFTISCILIFVIIFKPFYGVSVDGVLLEYVYFWKSGLLFRVLPFLASLNIELIIKVVVALLILIGIILYKNCKKQFIKAFACTYTIVCLINTFCSIYSFEHERKIESKQELQEILDINAILEKQEQDVLVITEKQFDNLLETFLISDIAVTSINKINNFEKTYVNIYDLRSNYPNESEFNDITNIGYIITDNKIKLYGDNCELQYGASEESKYRLYKIEGNDLYITLDGAFPCVTGESKTIRPVDDLYTVYEMTDTGEFKSNDRSQGGTALVYGPYEPIMQGVYDITFYYRYKGVKEENKSLGYVDVNFCDYGLSSEKVEFFSGNNSVTINDIEVDENLNQIETRMFTDISGIYFERLVITKKK